MSLTFGELFAGIGGFSLGLERAGMTCKWQVEIDPYATAVLKKHWPQVPKWDDVRTFPPQGDWGVDIICGGFPCQDISVAGKGAGLAGERSGLWHQFARIIGEIRPRYVVVENVAALLTRGMDAVLGTLSEIGYDAEWHVIPASAVGAPHRRERVWIVAHADSGRLHRIGTDARNGGTLSAKRQKRVVCRGGCGGDVPNTEGQRRREGRARRVAGVVSRQEDAAVVADAKNVKDGSEDDDGERRIPSEKNWLPRKPGAGSGDYERVPTAWWSVEPDVGRVAHGVPARVDRLRCLGNAVVPQVVEIIGRAILEAEARMTA